MYALLRTNYAPPRELKSGCKRLTFSLDSSAPQRSSLRPRGHYARYDNTLGLQNAGGAALHPMTARGDIPRPVALLIILRQRQITVFCSFLQISVVNDP